jgi:hypothetical protein
MKNLILVLSLIFSMGVFSQAKGLGEVKEFNDSGQAAVSVETLSEVSVKAEEQEQNPLDGIFGTFFALVAFIPVAVQFLRRFLFPKATGLGIQIFSWVAGLIITMAGWLLNLGFLDGLSIWMALLYGAGASLAANGIFDTGLITAIFKLFGLNR